MLATIMPVTIVATATWLQCLFLFYCAGLYLFSRVYFHLQQYISNHTYLYFQQSPSAAVVGQKQTVTIGFEVLLPPSSSLHNQLRL